MNQNKSFLTLFFLFIFFICFSSCKPVIDSKDSYLKEYKAFIEEIKENKNEYSEEDWKKKDEEFTTFSEELYDKYQEELSFMEQARIAKYALQYGSTRGLKAINNAIEGEEIEDAIEEFTNIFDEDILNELDVVINDLKKAWDEDLRDDLKDKLDELKVKLEDEKFKEDLSNKIEEIEEIINDEDIQNKIKDVSKELNELLSEINEKMKE